MKFDCKLAMVDFFPHTADFQPSEQLTEQNVIQGLKLIMSNLKGPKWCMKVT